MKIRNGFISNSSSSSFIIGIGEIINENNFLNYIKDIKNCTFTIKSVREILESKSFNRFNYQIIDNKFYYVNTSFDDQEVLVEFNPENLDDKFVKISYYGNEGDQAFREEDDYYMNYDIDSSFFDLDIQKLFNIDSSNGIENYEYKYGAGRNG